MAVRRSWPRRLKEGLVQLAFGEISWSAPWLAAAVRCGRFVPLSAVEPNTVNNFDEHQLILSAIMFLYVRAEGSMNRYFFHVACARGMYMDENGRDFSDLKGAKAYATTIAAELARNGSYVGCSVCIANERGKELGLVSIGSGWVKVVRID
jgi:hypothetical protein